MIEQVLNRAFKGTRKKYFSRKALPNPNLAYFVWRYLGNAGRTMRARSSQCTHPEAKRVAQVLAEKGIVTGASKEFLGAAGQAALGEASKLVVGLSDAAETRAASSSKKDYMVNLIPWEFQHEADSAFVKVALDPQLLESVSSYLGMWPRLHAIGAWANYPTPDEAKESQLWHRDPEDMQLVKVFVYLTDVDNNSGPFSYIPKSHPFSSGAAKTPQHKDPKRITDAEMQTAFPRESWLTCTGPAGTMILADTVGYHRGGKPTTGKRVLITFTYTSGLAYSARKLRINGTPQWIDNDMQRYAL